MSRYSKHIKQDALRAIINQDGPCESRMNEIRQLVGLPPVDANTGDGSNEASAADMDAPGQSDSQQGEIAPGQVDSGVSGVGDGGEGSLLNDSISRLTENLTGRDLVLAKNLITELMKTKDISWDQNSLEMKINGKNVSFSNMNLLISKVVGNSSITIPLGLVTLVFHMLLNRIPLSYQRDGDTRMIRNALINITKAGTDITQPVVNEDNRGKRAREDDEEEEISEEQLSKKARTETQQEAGNLDTGNTQDRTLRRSTRRKLKPELYDSWRQLNS